MLSDEDIKKIVDQYKPTFTQCWRDAFNTYATKYDETKIDHSPLARAILLRDHCVANAIRAFADIPHTTAKKANGLFFIELSGEPLGLDGSVAARLKKFNQNMRTSNIPTRQSTMFDEQRPVLAMAVQLQLYGEPLTIRDTEPTHINIGYLPNTLWTGVEGVYANMPNGKRSIKWVYKISDDDDQAIVIEM